MKKLLMKSLIATAFLVPAAIAESAEAREYCREYTKSVRIDGRVQTGYGTACQQEDGSWMIVKSRGEVDPFDALRNRNVTIVAQNDPIYYRHGPYSRPVTYYAPQRYRHSYAAPGFYFSFGNDWNRPRHYGRNQRWNHHGRDHHRRGRH